MVNKVIGGIKIRCSIPVDGLVLPLDTTAAVVFRAFPDEGNFVGVLVTSISP